MRIPKLTSNHGIAKTIWLQLYDYYRLMGGDCTDLDSLMNDYAFILDKVKENVDFSFYWGFDDASTWISRDQRDGPGLQVLYVARVREVTIR